MKREFYENLLFGGYSIFLKRKTLVSDVEFMKLFGIEEIELLPYENELDFYHYDQPKVYVTENGSWKHVIDNWSFSFCHRYVYRYGRPKNEDLLLELSNEYEILEFYVSDVDESYRFRYLSEGILKRRYSVQPVNGSNSEKFVVKDFGSGKKMEREILEKGGHLKIIKGICELYDVQYQQILENIRCYKIIK